MVVTEDRLKAEKLYNKLAKECVDESITDYAISTSLPLLSQSDEQEIAL